MKFYNLFCYTTAFFLPLFWLGKALKSETPTSINRNLVTAVGGNNSGSGNTGNNSSNPSNPSRTNSSSNLIKQNSKSDNIRNNITSGSGNICKLPGKDHKNSSSFDKDSNTPTKGNVITSTDSSVTSVPPV